MSGLSPEMESRLLSCVSHDLRNVLHLGSMNVALLKPLVADQAAAPPLARIERSLARLSHLTDDLNWIIELNSNKAPAGQSVSASLSQTMSQAVDCVRAVGTSSELSVGSTFKSTQVKIEMRLEQLLLLMSRMMRFVVEGCAGKKVYVDLRLPAKWAHISIAPRKGHFLSMPRHGAAIEGQNHLVLLAAQSVLHAIGGTLECERKEKGACSVNLWLPKSSSVVVKGARGDR